MHRCSPVYLRRLESSGKCRSLCVIIARNTSAGRDSCRRLPCIIYSAQYYIYSAHYLQCALFTVRNVYSAQYYIYSAHYLQCACTACTIMRHYNAHCKNMWFTICLVHDEAKSKSRDPAAHLCISCGTESSAKCSISRVTIARHSSAGPRSCCRLPRTSTSNASLESTMSRLTPAQLFIVAQICTSAGVQIDKSKFSNARDMVSYTQPADKHAHGTSRCSRTNQTLKH